jgi:hypothetical protein
MSPQKTSQDLRSVTFSQASAGGLTHSGWLVGPTTDPSGQDRALVNHSVSPAKAQEQTTRDTCGPLFGGSSPSADLQRALENRLQAQTDVNGSLEYVLTWKRWDIGLGPQICALRASGRRTSDSGCGGMDGWPKTPQASDGEGGVMEIRPGTSGKYKLRDYAMTASLTGPDPSGGRAGTGNGGGCRLDGWDTPRGTGGGNVSRGHDRKDELLLAGQAQAAGWATSRAEDAESAGMRHSRGVADTLTAQSRMAGYPTPQEDNVNNSMGHKGTAFSDLPTVTQTMLPDMTGWKLNPRFSLWLMGYPVEWACCGARAMQSCRKSPRGS